MWDNGADARGQGASVETVELVGGGLAEWPSGKGPRGETIAPAAFVDVTGAEHLLALSRHFHAAESEGWEAAARWEREPLTLVVEVRVPLKAAFRVPLDGSRHAALINAALRDGGIYLVPTVPRLGINARLARDGSVWVEVDRGFAEDWKRMTSE
jgi:hypothetical protein